MQCKRGGGVSGHLDSSWYSWHTVQMPSYNWDMTRPVLLPLLAVSMIFLWVSNSGSLWSCFLVSLVCSWFLRPLNPLSPLSWTLYLFHLSDRRFFSSHRCPNDLNIKLGSQSTAGQVIFRGHFNFQMSLSILFSQKSLLPDVYMDNFLNAKFLLKHHLLEKAIWTSV